jgi:hypothetical protein
MFTSSLVVNGQITVTQSDLPVQGEVWVELSDSRTGVHTITAPGGPQSWDYSNAFQVDDTTVIGFASTASTPPGWASNFPNATMAFYEVFDSTAVYLYTSNDGLYVDGLYDITGEFPLTVLDMNPDQLIYPTPFTMGSTRMNYAGFEVEQPAVPPTPGFLIKIFLVNEFEGDGYGSLITPAGTYPNVLRDKGIEYTIDSTFIDVLGNGNYTFLNANGPSDSTVIYRFVTNGPNAILMEIEEDPASLGTSLGASYYNPNLVGIQDNVSSSNELSIYPNPVSGGILNVEIDFDAAESLMIYDAHGRLIESKIVQSAKKVNVDTHRFSKGIYFLEIRGNGITPVRDKFIVQ